MPKRLRAWIASPAEARTAWVIASLCVAVAIGSFLWPQIKPDSGIVATSMKPSAVVEKRPGSPHHSIQTKTIVQPGKASKPVARVKPAPSPASKRVTPEQTVKPVASKTVASGHYIQLGAFKEPKRAQALARRLTPTWKIHIVSRSNGMLAVWVGPYATSKEASRYREKIASTTKLKGFVVKH